MRKFGHTPHLVLKTIFGQPVFSVNHHDGLRKDERETDAVPLTKIEATLPISELARLYGLKALKAQTEPEPNVKTVKEKTTIAPREAYMTKSKNVDGSMGRLDMHGGDCPTPRGSNET